MANGIFICLSPWVRLTKPSFGPGEKLLFGLKSKKNVLSRSLNFITESSDITYDQNIFSVHSDYKTSLLLITVPIA